MYDIRRCATLILAVAAAAAACMAVVPGASAAPARPAGGAQRLATSGNPWGKAQEVPGTAALNKGLDAQITSVSCASAGNCSAVGYYTGGYGPDPFVVSEVHGRWRKAEEVPGIAALNGNGAAEIASVSCASAGNCSAGGLYDGAGEAFVVSEVRGRWRKAEEVPGAAALNRGGNAEITSVSCASAGNCSAGGDYASASGLQVFVVSEVRGTWRKAEEVPGTAALNRGGNAEITSVSCASAGNCSAGGLYGAGEAFVVSEVHGRWRKAEEVPGTAALNKAGDAQIASVSCASAGNCSAGGHYASASGFLQAFVVSEVHGTWRKAKEVPGTAALNKNGAAGITSVSCASAGNCSAGGYYDSASGLQAFVVSEVHGRWRKAEEVPGTAALHKNGNAGIASVSCASAGNCSAGGDYASASGLQVFVVSEVRGTWRKAEEVPGTAALNIGGDAGITSVSCGSAGHCGAGGYYAPASGSTQAFVVSRK